MKKEIYSIYVERQIDDIKPIGETREIKLRGTSGSGFSMEINDSSGDCILEKPIQNVDIPQSGVYILNQKFPDITTSASGGLIEEIYEIIVTPHADVDADIKRVALRQYPDVTITLAVSTSQTGPALTVRDDAGVFSSTSVKVPAKRKINVTKSITLTITESSSEDGFFYIKDSFNNSLSKNTTITKKVTTKEEPKLGSYVILKPLTTKAIGATVSGSVTKGSQNYPITGDVATGMSVYGKLTKDKVVHKSLEVATCKRATDKFELSDTVGLFPGMTGKVNGLNNFILTSVDCGKNITVDKRLIIPEDTDVSFVYEINSSIGKIHTQSNENGDACIELKSKIMIVNQMTLTLDSDKSEIFSDTVYSGSGTNTITMTNNIEFTKSGSSDVTHTLDLDNIITRTPNAKNIKVNIAKNSGENSIVTTTYTKFDFSTRIANITGHAKHGGANASAVKGANIVYYTPPTGFVGTDRILYTLSDEENTSAEKRIDITVK
tara:strand:- start:2024 stop:3502 length:1479 start_codon:yes stop_codon:yes gene_type:complete